MMRSVFLAAVATGALANIADRGTVATLDKWCLNDVDCRAEGDAEGKCEAPAKDGCACGANFGPRMFGDLSVGLCFPKTRDLDLNLVLTTGEDCQTTGDYPFDFSVREKDALVKVITDHFQGRVVQFSARCPAPGTPKGLRYVNAKIEVPTSRVTEVVAMELAFEKVLGAKLTSVQDLSKLGAVHTSTDLRLRDVNNFVQEKCTPALLASSNAREGVEFKPYLGTTIPNRDAKSLAITTEECEFTKCKIGYTRKVNTATGAWSCTAVGASRDGTCVVDGDCSWEEGKSLCQNKVCVEPPQMLKYRTDGPVDKNWCLTDKNCRTHDPRATCSANRGLGNWCSCSVGFGYPSPLVSVCLKSDTAHETVEMSYALTFSTGVVCPVSNEVRTSIRKLVTAVIGTPVSTIQDVCARGQSGVTFMGTATVKVTLAKELAALTSLTGLVDKVLADIAANDPANNPTLSSRSADALAVNPYLALNGAKPSAAWVGSLYNCQTANALASRADPQGNCHALVCDGPTFGRFLQQDVWKCVLNDERILRRREADDDWATTEVIAMAFGGIVTVGVIVVSSIVIATGGKKAAPVAEEPEAENAAEENQ